MMFNHPIFKVGLRSLFLDRSTSYFIGFVALIVVLLIALRGIEEAQQGSIFPEDDVMLMVTNAVAPRYPLPVRYVEAIKQQGLAIDGVAAITIVPATFKSQRQPVPVVAANAADILRANADLVVWEEMAKRWIEEPDGVLIGSDLATRFGLKVGDSMPLRSNMFSQTGQPKDIVLRVSAIYDIKDRAYPSYGIVVHERLVRPMGQTTAAQGANMLLVRLRNREDHQQIAELIDVEFSNGLIPTRTYLREQYMQNFRDQGEGLTELVSLYGIAGVLAGLLLIVGFCYYAAAQLRNTSNNFRLLGFSSKATLHHLASSQTAIVCIGVIVGVVLAFAAQHLFGRMIASAFPMFSISTTWALGVALGVAGLAYVLSCLAVLPIAISKEEVVKLGGI